MALLDQFLASLMGAQTPWAQQQMNQMLGQGNMTTQGAPELPVSKGAANAGAPSMGLPATDSQVSRMNLGGPMPGPQSKPVPAPAPAPMSEPTSAPVSFGTYLSGALRGASQANNPIGMLLGGLGGAMGAGEQVDQKRQTYQLLIENGLSPAEAALAIQNPALAQQVAARREKTMMLEKADKETVQNLDFLVKTGRITEQQAKTLKLATPERRKQIIDAVLSGGGKPIAQEDQFGRKSYYTIDPITGQPVPFNVGGAGGAGLAAGGQIATPAPMAPPQQIGAPAPIPPVSEVATPSAQPQQDVEVGQPQIVPETQTAPQPQPQLPGGRKVMSMPVPETPDGFVQEQSPNGGFLYEADGTPVLVLKSEADARAKATEKRAMDAVDAEATRSGTSSLIKGARDLTKLPGFNEALNVGRTSMDLSVGGGQFGQIGGDPKNLLRSLGRQFMPNDPRWSTFDAIENVQKSLSLIVGRAFLKGQGQVSNFERQMVADAISDISKATSPADFQFRLNHAQNLVDAAAKGQKIEGASVNMGRPTTEEIVGALYGERNALGGREIDPVKLTALSKKYNVDPADMRDNIGTVLDQYGEGDGQKSTQAEPGRTKPLTTKDLTQMLKNVRRG